MKRKQHNTYHVLALDLEKSRVEPLTNEPKQLYFVKNKTKKKPRRQENMFNRADNKAILISIQDTFSKATLHKMRT